MKKIFKESIRTLLIIAGLFGIVALVSAWTAPSSAPPGGNVPAPLNVGNVGQPKQGGLILNTGGATNGLIVDKGNVGIGTTEPARKLSFGSSVNNDPLFIQADAGGIGMDQFSAGARIVGDPFSNNPVASIGYYAGNVISHANWNSLLMVRQGGNVGIGTTNPSTKLQVNGGIKTSGLETNSIRLTGGTQTNGKVLTANEDGFGSWQTPSGGGITNSSFQVDQYSISSSVATDRADMGLLDKYFVCVLSKVKASNPSSATLVTGCEITTADTIYPGKWVLISNSTQGQSWCSAYCIKVK